MRIRPDRSKFERSAEGFSLAPLWTELLADVSTPVGVFPAMAGDGPGILLESVERSERWGRYSFVAGDPAAVVIADADGLHIEDVARRLVVQAPWGIRLFPNMYMMFVADTTFYRKTTAYKLAESVIREAIPTC